MQFSEIPGLLDLKEHLIGAHKRGKVAHAQLFSGRSHTAALPMALAYASYLMCTNKQENDSCGSCPNCVRIKKLVHPDIHLHFPKVSATENKYEKVIAEALPKFREFVQESPFGDLEGWARKYGQENKNLLISREDSRQMLRSVSMRSVEGSYKILIIWMPEMMNSSSANAILKILEEPPQNTIYLLVTYNYENLLATITSRTQLVSVPPNSEEDIIAHLQRQGTDPEKASQAAKMSEGKPGLAFQLAQAEESHEYEAFQKWMLECWNRNLTDLVQRSEEFSKSGKTLQKSTMNYSISMIRNAVIHASGQLAPTQSNAEASFVGKFADRLGFPKLEKIYELLNAAASHLDRNSNPRITHLNLSMDILKILNG